MKKLYWLYIAAIFYWVGLYTYSPILPGYIKNIVLDLGLTGSILSMFGLLQIIIRLPLGIVSDITGKRRLFSILGLIALGLGPLVLSVSTSGGGLFIGRAITGIAAGTWVPLSALILKKSSRDVFNTTSVLSFLSNFGCILGVSLTPLLISTKLGLLPAFWAPIVASFAAIIILLLIKENDPKSHSKFSLNDITSVILNPLVLVPAVLCALVEFGNFASTFTFIPLIGRDLGLSGVQLSWVMDAFFISSMLTNLMLSKFLFRINRSFLALLSFILMAVGIFISGLANNFSILLFAQVLIGLSFGITYPLLMGFTVSNSEKRSTTIAVGLFQSVYAIGMFAGPIFSTNLAGLVGIPTMLVFVALIIIIFSAGLITLYWKISNKKITA